MKTELSGSDLHLLIETGREIYQLVPKDMRPIFNTSGTENLPNEKSAIISELSSRTRKDLSARVTLSFVDETKDRGGIDVEFSPQNEFDWSKIREISVKVAYRLYRQLAIVCPVIAYYSGDDRVRIKFGL